VSPLSRACKALCRLDGHPENIRFEGAPMWQSYMPQARAVLDAIRDPSKVTIESGICSEKHWRWMVDVILQEG